MNRAWLSWLAFPRHFSSFWVMFMSDGRRRLSSGGHIARYACARVRKNLLAVHRIVTVRGILKTTRGGKRPRYFLSIFDPGRGWSCSIPCNTAFQGVAVPVRGYRSHF